MADTVPDTAPSASQAETTTSEEAPKSTNQPIEDEEQKKPAVKSTGQNKTKTNPKPRPATSVTEKSRTTHTKTRPASASAKTKLAKKKNPGNEKIEAEPASSIPETPTQETPAQETPAQETPAQETPAQEIPATETVQPSNSSANDPTPTKEEILSATTVSSTVPSEHPVEPTQESILPTLTEVKPQTTAEPITDTKEALSAEKVATSSVNTDEGTSTEPTLSTITATPETTNDAAESTPEATNDAAESTPEATNDATVEPEPEEDDKETANLLRDLLHGGKRDSIDVKGQLEAARHPSTVRRVYSMPTLRYLFTVLVADKNQIVVVRIERVDKQKPFLGGYKHRLTGIEYHHASAQTDPRPLTEEEKRVA